MKNLLIITALVLGVMTNAYSQQRNNHYGGNKNYVQPQPKNSFSKLTLQSQNGRDFKAIINGITYLSYSGFVNVEQIVSGYHNITIIREHHGRNGKFTTSGATQIYVPTQSIVTATVQHGSKIFVNHIVEIPKQHYHHKNNHKHYHNPVAIHDYEFSLLKRDIMNLWFEQERMDMLFSAVGRNYFTSAQVADLCRTLMSDNSKLDFAKSAYSKTVDQSQYGFVFNELSFSSSRSELAKYTGQYYSSNTMCYQR